MKILIVLTSFVLITSCIKDNRYNTIKGKWKCSSWLVNDVQSHKPINLVNFEFSNHKTYKSVLGNKSEEGEFKISDNIIVFFPDNTDGMEIQVQIIKLTNDSLFFLMNNGSVKEEIKLTKIK